MCHDGSAAVDLYPVGGEHGLFSQGNRVTLPANVYEAGNRKLVLSATSRAVNPESIEEIGQDMYRAAVTSLSREKLLRRLSLGRGLASA